MCEMLKKSQARLVQICCLVKRKEQIINDFQLSCFSAVTWTTYCLTSIVWIVRVEVGRNME